MNVKKVYSSVMLFGTVLGIGLSTSSISGSLVGSQNEAYAEEVTAGTPNYNYEEKGAIHIHKVVNTNGDGQKVGDIDNHGKEITLPNGVKPLEGVEFSVLHLSKSDAKALGWSDVSKEKGQGIDVDKAKALIKTKSADVTKAKTDVNGTIDIPVDIDTEDLTNNLYLILETGSVKGVVDEAYPMIVNVPEDSGTKDVAYNYDVHVYPKNYFQLNSAELDKKDEDGKALADTVWELHKDNASNDLVGTYTTGKDGKISVDGLELGDYYFQEKDLGSESNKNTFLLDGKKFKFTIKQGETAKTVLNAINYKKPVIEKVIDKETVDTGEDVKYTITPSIPGNVGSYLKYTVKDTLGEELTYDSSDAISGMTENTDYTIKREGQTTYYDFSDSGRQKLQQAFDKGDRDFKIFLNAHTNEKAKPDKTLRNDVHSIYNNGFEPESETPEDHAYTIVGAHKFLKEDGDTQKALAGAKFVVKNKIDSAKVTYMQQDPTTKKITWVTDKQINDYALEEVQAPSGYTPNKHDVPFIVSNDDKSHAVTDIKNLKTPETVVTGGVGIVAFLAVALAGTGMYVVYKKVENKEA